MGSKNTSWAHLLGWDQMHHDAREVTNMFWQLSDWIQGKKMLVVFTFMRVYVFNRTSTTEAIICNLRPWVHAFQFNTLVSSFISAKKVKSTSFYNTQQGKDCFGISCCSSPRFPGFGAPSHMAWMDIIHCVSHIIYYILCNQINMKFDIVYKYNI